MTSRPGPSPSTGHAPAPVLNVDSAPFVMGGLNVDEQDAYRLLFKLSPRPMWVYDTETLHFLAVNYAAVEHYGWSRDEFLAMTVLDISPPEDVPAVRRLLEEPAPPVRTAGVWRNRRRDGTVIDVDVVSAQLTFGGRPARLVLAEDVTEKRRLDEALRASEERFRNLFSHAPVAQATFSLDGRFLQVNPAMCQMTGYGELDLMDRSLDQLIAEGLRPEWARRLSSLASDEASFFTVESQLLRSDGATVEVLVSAARVHDADGAASCIVALVQDISDAKAAQVRLAHQALHDDLTDLPNRALFLDRLSQALRRLERRQGMVAVLFLDLDRFKSINDVYGHSAGDQVLVEVASRIRGVLRSEDTTARLGGDEFILLCEELPDEAAVAEVARRVLAGVAGPFRLADGRELSISASIGIAVTRTGDVATEVLLGDADTALYQAKARGRNRYAVCDTAMRERHNRRLEQAHLLQQALDTGEFYLVYQPEIRLTDESTSGMEALVRWAHPRRGVVGPQEFIPLAEETGLVTALGAWVLRQACRQLAQWDSHNGHAPLLMSVNLSARQLGEANLIDTVADVLAETAISPARLCLEITESVLMEDVESSVEALLGLKALGVRLAIDDFGTGYSSLSYLRRFPVDVVKVDRSFVAGLGSDPAAEAIVAAVVNLAHALGLEVVGEGVETEEQLVALRALGCDRVQGYYWSAPMAPQDAERWTHHEPAASVSPTTVNVGRLLVQRIEALRATTGRSVILNAPPGLPYAVADPGALRNVFDHLLGNAVTFSPPDTPIVVTAQSARRWLRITVSDYGIGMTADEATRCFEQFWQADVPAQYRSSGTGIGLSIVRSLVDAMGGSISVKSAPGKGSTFTMTLPRSALTAERGKALARDAPAVGEPLVIREFMRQIGVATGPTRRQ